MTQPHIYVDQSNSSCGDVHVQLELPQFLEPNEAYACVTKQNQAYEKIVISPGQVNPAQTIALKSNEAYESVANNPTIIYEEVM